MLRIKKLFSFKKPLILEHTSYQALIYTYSALRAIRHHVFHSSKQKHNTYSEHTNIF